MGEDSVVFKSVNGNGVANSTTNSSTTSCSDTDRVSEKIVNDARCGYFGCRPSWLQCCDRPKVYLIFFCLFVLVQSFLVSGINNVNTTSLERRFDLPSSKVGLISSAYDFSAGSTVILISYYGGRGNKPRWIAFASLAVGVGGFIMALPHFTTGLYDGNGNGLGDTCHINATAVCESDATLQNYLYVFILGMVVIGLGGTTLYSVGTSFLDESVSVQDSPLYIGIMYSISTLGPALGYIIGGQFLSMYTDFDQASASTVVMESDDPRWVGAWWIGYGVAGILAICISLILFSYPRHLRGYKKACDSRLVSQAHDNGGEEYTSNPNFGKSISDMPKAVKIILTNPTFMFITIAGTIDALALSGFSTFLPKFIQNQFNQDPSWAAYLSGFVVIPAACGGQILGGILIKKFNLNIRKTIILICVGAFMSLLCSGVFWVHCEPANVAGVETPYYNSTLDIGNVENQCNSHCHCTTESYKVICAWDQSTNTRVQYFSPCHAGCTTASTDKIYSNCSCVTGNSTEVKEGQCDNNCDMMPVFLIFGFCVIFFTFLTLPPGASVTLRCVPNSQRAFALGIQWVFIRFLGSFPGPILFGAIIDSTCLVWKEKCGTQGSCWIYDNGGMSMNLFLLSIAVKVPVCIFFYLAKVFYKAPPKTAESMTLSSYTGSNPGVLATPDSN